MSRSTRAVGPRRGRLRNLIEPSIAAVDPLRNVRIYAILLLSLVLNVAGNTWGAPRRWHPDELTERADMLWGGRTLNPHFFPYGGLAFYVFTAGAVVPVRVYERLFDRRPDIDDTIAKRLWDDRDAVRVIRMARTVSALLGTLVTLLTYIIGLLLYDRAVGTVAALLTTVAGSGVVVAHLATVDSSANFWYWTAVLATLGIWKSGQVRYYVAAGLLAGIAAGVKVDRAMVLIPLLVAHFLRGGTRLKSLSLALVLIPIGFIAANPACLVSPFEFLDGFSRDFFFQLVRPAAGGATGSYLTFADQMRAELGWPLTASALAAALYALREVRAGRRPRVSHGEPRVRSQASRPSARTMRYFIIGLATFFTSVPVMAHVAKSPRPTGGANSPRPIAMTITVPNCSGFTPS